MKGLPLQEKLNEAAKRMDEIRGQAQEQANEVLPHSITKGPTVGP
jgi:hypothetical protein